MSAPQTVFCGTCGVDHAIEEWLGAGEWQSIPLIVCPKAPFGELLLVDTRYFGAGAAFPKMKGRLWITSRG
jgi:hypothetical protein